MANPLQWGTLLTPLSKVSDIRRYVGEARYDLVRSMAWGESVDHRAQEIRSYLREPSPLSIHQQIGSEIWEYSTLSNREKISLAFDVYADSPDYGMMTYSIAPLEQEMTHEDRNLYWAKIIANLDAEDERQSDPIEYFIWAGIFGATEIGTEAWHALTADLSARRLISRVVAAAASAPMRLKVDVYERLIESGAWGRNLVSKDLLSSATGLDIEFDVAAGRHLAALLDKYPLSE